MDLFKGFKSFLKNLSKINFDKAHNFVQRSIRTWRMLHRWNQNLWLWVVGENWCRIFRLKAKLYVRQIKLFNLMNYRAIHMLSELDVRPVVWTIFCWKCLFVFQTNILPSPSKNGPFLVLSTPVWHGPRNKT